MILSFECTISVHQLLLYWQCIFEAHMPQKIAEAFKLCNIYHQAAFCYHKIALEQLYLSK